MDIKNNPAHKLNELQATAICGNDISSSCLYVSALTILYAGQYAWISLLVVALVLYMFRKIYGEVVGAIPLNGGAYNVLLNSSTKRLAAFAASLTILSYMATAVISASEAMHYLKSIYPHLSIFIATVSVLLFFSGLAIIGIGESSFVAVLIFILHMVTLLLLVMASVWFVYNNGFDLLHINWQLPIANGNIMTGLFFGFAIAMLGISGFESSANFVEEQKPGVFRKTLRNMWLVVSFFNPVLAFLIICVMPVTVVGENQESLLAFLGKTTGGSWLSTLVSVDAVLVLCGAVLTSFVGVSGLLERIALDRILPNFFLKKNKRGSNYRIILTFFVLCITVLLVTKGNLRALAGVYTFSFLAVMALFGVGNLLLKLKRSKLPRPERARGLIVFFAISLIAVAFIGNYKLNRESFYTFIKYLVPTFLFSTLMLNRSEVVKFIIEVLERLFKPFNKFAVNSNLYLKRMHNRIVSQEFVFFTKGDNVAILNRVMQYVSDNETTKKIKIVTITADGESNPHLIKDIEVLDRAYPEIDIEYLEITGVFGPDLISDLSAKWKIPKNFMFIGSPSNKFTYQVSELGGVRLII